MQAAMGQAAPTLNSLLDMDQTDGDSEELIETHLLAARRELIEAVRVGGDCSSPLNRLLQLKCPVSLKYAQLNVSQLLKDNNMSVGQLKAVPVALGMLEKYGRHLLKPPGSRVEQWRQIKFNNPIFKDRVLPMQGALEVVQQMGYSDAADYGLQFALDEPDVEATSNMVADILLARTEMDRYLMGRHPHPETIHAFLPDSTVDELLVHWDQVLGAEAGTVNINPSPPSTSTHTQQQVFHPPTPVSALMEVDPTPSGQAQELRQGSEVVGQAILSHSMSDDSLQKACDICGETAATVWCKLCDNKQLCDACDDMWHRHPKRQNHDRKPICSLPPPSSAPPADAIMGPFGIRAVHNLSHPGRGGERSPTPVSGAQQQQSAAGQRSASHTPPPLQRQPTPPPHPQAQQQGGMPQQQQQQSTLSAQASLQQHQQKMQFYLQRQEEFMQQQQQQGYSNQTGDYPSPQAAYPYSTMGSNPSTVSNAAWQGVAPALTSRQSSETHLVTATQHNNNTNTPFPPFPNLDPDPSVASQYGDGGGGGAVHPSPSSLQQRAGQFPPFPDYSLRRPPGGGAVGGSASSPAYGDLSLRQQQQQGGGGADNYRGASPVSQSSGLLGPRRESSPGSVSGSGGGAASMVSESTLLKAVLAESDYEKRAAKCDVRLLTLDEDLKEVDAKLNHLMLTLEDDLAASPDFMTLNRRKAVLMKEHKALSSYKTELAQLMATTAHHHPPSSSHIYHPPPLSSSPPSYSSPQALAGQGSYPSSQGLSPYPPEPSPTQQPLLGFSYPHQASLSPSHAHEPVSSSSAYTNQPVSSYQQASAGVQQQQHPPRGGGVGQGYYPSSSSTTTQPNPNYPPAQSPPADYRFPNAQESLVQTGAAVTSGVDRSSILPQWQMNPGASSSSSSSAPTGHPQQQSKPSPSPYPPPRYQGVADTYPGGGVDAAANTALHHHQVFPSPVSVSQIGGQQLPFGTVGQGQGQPHSQNQYNHMGGGNQFNTMGQNQHHHAMGQTQQNAMGHRPHYNSNNIAMRQVGPSLPVAQEHGTPPNNSADLLTPGHPSSGRDISPGSGGGEGAVQIGFENFMRGEEQPCFPPQFRQQQHQQQSITPQQPPHQPQQPAPPLWQSDPHLHSGYSVPPSPPPFSRTPPPVTRTPPPVSCTPPPMSCTPPPVSRTPPPGGSTSFPVQQWMCSHCTLINQAGTRVCTMCHRTSDNPTMVGTEAMVRGSPSSAADAACNELSMQAAALTLGEAEASKETMPAVDRQHLDRFGSRIAEEQDQIFLEKKEAREEYFRLLQQQGESDRAPSMTPPPLPSDVAAVAPKPPVPARRTSAAASQAAASTASQQSVAAAGTKQPTVLITKQPKPPESTPPPSAAKRSSAAAKQSVPSDNTATASRNTLRAESGLPTGPKETTGSGGGSGGSGCGDGDGVGSLDSPATSLGGDFSTSMERFSEQKKQKQLQLDGADLMHYVKMADRMGCQMGEIQAALLRCHGDHQQALGWLRTEWSKLVQVVVSSTRAEGQRSDHNDVGDLSAEEARRALRESKGELVPAVKSCTAQRKELYAKLNPDSTFAREEVLQAMLQSCGQEDAARQHLYTTLTLPYVERVWAGTETERATETTLLQLAEAAATRDCHSVSTSVIAHATFQTTISNTDIDRDRRVRMILVEGKLKSWGRADLVIKLLDVDLPALYPPTPGLQPPYSLEDVVEAVRNCRDRNSAKAYLTQECSTCFSHYPMSKIRNLNFCQCKICSDCLKQNFEVVIREKHVRHWTCPICGLPDLNDLDVAVEYLSFLGLLLQTQVDKEVYELFEIRVRDWHLQNEPTFRWCAHCGNGFLAEEGQLRMTCPHCRDKTCFKCKRQWEDQHEGLTCDEFKQWKIDNDPNNQAVGLARHLEENGIDCPSCKMRYALAKGGCMHFKCPQCGHEFCSGCYQPFYQRGTCTRLKKCKMAGLHAHHPRDCFFYLRDEDVEKLQSLLKTPNGNVHFNTVPPDSQEDSSVCPVIEQKEFDSGKSDECCGKETHEGHAGLCLAHYKEYLVGLINKNHIDPAIVMTTEELQKLLKRTEVTCPKISNKETDINYRKRLVKFVKEKSPLPKRGP